MTGKQSKNLALLAFLLASSAISGCNDSSSIRQFGTSTSVSELSSGTLLNTDRAIELSGEDLDAEEYLEANFIFETTTTSGRVWIEAELISGPALDVYFVEQSKADEWREYNQSGASLDTFSFDTPYEALSNNILTDSFATEKVYITSGNYAVIIDNTAAGSVEPASSSEVSYFNLRAFIDIISQDGVSEARMISVSKIKVLNRSMFDEKMPLTLD